MLLETITGVTEKSDIQVQKSCESIYIVTTAGALSNSVLVTARLVGKTGNVVLYTDMPVLDLAELLVQGEGLYFQDAANYVGNVPRAGARSILQIPISADGGYALNNEEYISLDFKGLTAGTTYVVGAMESTDLDGRLYQIDKKTIPAPRTQQRWKPSPGSVAIALTWANLDRIQTYNVSNEGGKTVTRDATFTREELTVKALSENDGVRLTARAVATTPAVNLVDVIFGYDNLILINSLAMTDIEIWCTGAAGYTFYEMKTL